MICPLRYLVRLPLPLSIALVSCGSESAPEPGPASEEGSVAPTNRVDIPLAVRSNLGITFVTVERRAVEQTLRVPGVFELLPTARREYRTMLSGRVELLVEQFETVAENTELYRVDSPAWRDLQQELVEVESKISGLQAKLETFGPLLAAHDRHEQGLVNSTAIWAERSNQLESLHEAGGGLLSELAEVRAALATAQASLAEVQETKAQLHAARAESVAELNADRSRRSFLLDSASSLVGLSRAEIEVPKPSELGPRPCWQTIQRITVKAAGPGVVESLALTNGSWVAEAAAVLTVTQPERLRFRASGLQSDLGVLRPGLKARIVPPAPTTGGRSPHLQDAMEATLSLGIIDDPNDRTVDLYVVPERLSAWARPGVTAQLEITTDASTREELAIPLSAVQRDGLVPVIFRRAPDNPNQAIRIEADLGLNDGRWVEVRSGLRDGDEVVLDGAFQLMLATSGTMQKGGHFHADGTFHDGED